MRTEDRFRRRRLPGVFLLLAAVHCEPSAPNAPAEAPAVVLPAPNPTPAGSPTSVPAETNRISSCSDLEGGRAIALSHCAEGATLACLVEPTHPSLRGRGLTLTRCFDGPRARLRDTGERGLFVQEAAVLMIADPRPDGVVCWFASASSWAELPPNALEAAFEWAECTERTYEDPWGASP